MTTHRPCRFLTRLPFAVAATLAFSLVPGERAARAQDNAAAAPDPGGLGQDASGDAANTPRRSRQTRPRSAAPKKSRQATGKNALGSVAKTKKGAGDASRTRAGAAGGSSGSGISFRADIAPILVANCAGCHRPGRPGLDKGKLELTSFAKLMQGTPGEKVIEPGKPDESHLILRIKGDEQPRMPQGGNNNGLSQEAIGKFEQWIKAGARLDAGLDPKAAMESYASSPDEVRKNAIARMSTRDREQLVETAGRDRWKKTNPSLSPEIISGPHFVLFHNLPKDRAANLAKAMENQFTQFKRVLGGPATDWIEKVSLYVFNSPKDFIEFARTIENREVDASVVTSGKLSVPQPYVAAVDLLGGKKEEPATPRRRSRSRKAEERETAGAPVRTLAGLLTEGLGEAVVLADGKSPRWLAFGVGSFLASRIEPRNPHYRSLRELAYGKFKQGWDTKATEVLGESDQVGTEEIRGVGFAIVEGLILSPDLRPRFATFAHGMSQGADKLDDVLKEAYQATREEFLNRTGDWVASQYGRDQ